MRVYLSESNLRKAAAVAAVVTLMSVPRLVQGGKPLGLYIPATFVSMTLVAGAVTAWGRRAGMKGILTDLSTLRRGCAIALFFALAALPVQVLWLAPLLRNTLASGTNAATAILSYPPTAGGCAALLLWSAGFQVIFLQAAPMAFFTRLTGYPSVACALCVALRTYVAYRQVLLSGLTDGVGLLVLSAAGTVAVGCLLFARFGLVPAMVFAAGLDVHLFFHQAVAP